MNIEWVRQRRKHEAEATHPARPNLSTNRPITGVKSAHIRNAIDTVRLAESWLSPCGFSATNTDVNGRIDEYPPTHMTATTQNSSPSDFVDAQRDATDV